MLLKRRVRRKLLAIVAVLAVVFIIMVAGAGAGFSFGSGGWTTWPPLSWFAG